MNTTEKIRVAVLYGGRSGEHEISVVSATNVIQHLDQALFDILPIGIDKQGGWFLGDGILKKELNASAVLQLERDTKKRFFHPDIIAKPRLGYCSFEREEKNLTSTQQSFDFDVVFPVIHGTLCEDGTVQGLLELAEVPYVGSGVLSSSVSMDKDVSKRLVQNAGVAIVPYKVIKRGSWDNNPKHFCDMVEQAFQYPVFVKPANTGSSVGVHKVKNAQELVKAIQNAFLYDVKVVVEQGIDAMEIEVAVLESLEPGADPIMSVAGEVRPSASHEFYSYASKYTDAKGAELIIPAPISSELQHSARETAKVIFNALECEGMARVDLFLERGTNKIFFNEVNTIPGFTTMSMYPKLMEASGIGYSDLLTHLVMLALQRHARKEKLSREYIPD